MSEKLDDVDEAKACPELADTRRADGELDGRGMDFELAGRGNDIELDGRVTDVELDGSAERPTALLELYGRGTDTTRNSRGPAELV